MENSLIKITLTIFENIFREIFHFCNYFLFDSRYFHEFFGSQNQIKNSHIELLKKFAELPKITKLLYIFVYKSPKICQKSQIWSKLFLKKFTEVYPYGDVSVIRYWVKRKLHVIACHINFWKEDFRLNRAQWQIFISSFLNNNRYREIGWGWTSKSVLK